MFTLLRSIISYHILACAILLSPLQAKGQEIGGGLLYNGIPIETLRSSEILQASEALDYFSSYTLPGGYVAKGVAMRNLGHGNITITGIPAGAVVEMAFLYWAILNPTPTTAMAEGNFNGVFITGTLIGSCREPCWGAGLTHVYRADVTHLVRGNGTYTLSGFSSGLTTGGNPWETDVMLPLNEGATLVVIYRRSASPVQTIVMYEGCRFFLGHQRYTFNLSGFVADPVRKATLTIFGADGQSGGLVWDPEQNRWVYKDPLPDADIEYLEFNGSAIAGPPNSPWNGGDGRPLPQLWDTHTYDVTRIVSLGSKRVTIANPGFTTDKYVDCIVWVDALFGVTAKDTDGDGLVDAWEIEGYDHDGDGVKDVDLPEMGANPLRKDIFIEIDYMVAPDHTHKPKDEAVQIVTNAFANAPVKNPDRSEGITLHMDTGNLGGGNALPHQDTLIVWDGFDSIQKANFAKVRRPIFHYTIFAHDMEGMVGVSGISKGIPGSDFIVSLGSWTDKVGTINQQAGTFMHELGHNIGLRHGGGVHLPNYKPNYLSVMNYFFQMKGLRINGVDGHFDYSRFRNRTLTEYRLHEGLGIGGTINYGTRYTDANCNVKEVDFSKPIDWDGDGRIDKQAVTVDINGCDGKLQIIEGFKDWDHLVINGRALGVSSPEATRATSLKEESLPKEPDDEDYRVQIMPKAPALSDDDRPYPFPDAKTTEIKWGATGNEAITHYNVYILKRGTRKLLGTVPADPEGERYGTGVYRFELGRTGSVHKELQEDSWYGVSAVDRYGIESEIQSGGYPLKELSIEEWRKLEKELEKR